MVVILPRLASGRHQVKQFFNFLFFRKRHEESGLRKRLKKNEISVCNSKVSDSNASLEDWLDSLLCF